MVITLKKPSGDEWAFTLTEPERHSIKSSTHQPARPTSCKQCDDSCATDCAAIRALLPMMNFLRDTKPREAIELIFQESEDRKNNTTTPARSAVTQVTPLLLKTCGCSFFMPYSYMEKHALFCPENWTATLISSFIGRETVNPDEFFSLKQCETKIANMLNPMCDALSHLFSWASAEPRGEVVMHGLGTAILLIRFLLNDLESTPPHLNQ